MYFRVSLKRTAACKQSWDLASISSQDAVISKVLTYVDESSQMVLLIICMNASTITLSLFRVLNNSCKKHDWLQLREAGGSRVM